MNKFIVNKNGFNIFKKVMEKIEPHNNIKKIDIINTLKEHPKVFPYLITKMAPAIYNFLVLPIMEDQEKFLKLVHKQMSMNDLECCFVIHEDISIYFKENDVNISKNRPSGGTILFSDRLKLLPELEEYIKLDLSYSERNKEVEEFYESQPNSGYLFGDLTKGGRNATKEELKELGKINQKDPKVPNGLILCEECFEYKGECLDNGEYFKNQIMKVYCKCDNKNKCARCGELLYERKLYSNYYKKEDNEIWHVPGLIALSHECPN